MIKHRFTQDPKLLILMLSLFFIWGFITLLNDLLIPHLKALFHLSYAQAMLIQFCFFFTYVVMSIPMASVLNGIGYKKSIMLGLCIIAVGALIFLPAAAFSLYAIFLLGLFVLATGVVLLQVAANPCVTLLGERDTAASRLTFAQGINSLAYTIAPVLVGGLIVGGYFKLPYVLIAIVMVCVAVFISFFDFSRLDPMKSLNSVKPMTHGSQRSIWEYPELLYGALAIFLYVGAEVSAGSVLVNYLNLPTIANLSLSQASECLAYYWGGAMVGRLLGTYFLMKVMARKAIAFNASLAMILILIAVLASGHLAMWCILVLGLCNSILFPSIFSLSIESVDDDSVKKKGSGLLCSAIVGGAIIPVAQGFLADHIGLQHSFILLFFCYLYIAVYGFKLAR